MRKTFNKLVRDRIPEIIVAEGRQCATETMNESDYVQALLQKLVEEAQEVVGASQDHLIVELADVYEVMDAIVQACGLNKADVVTTQAQRRKERGGFENRVKLVWTE